MRIIVLFSLLAFAGFTLSAQKVTEKKDTLFAGKTPYGLLKKGNAQPLRYTIYNLKGVEQIELHSGRIEIKGKPGYVVTFLNNQMQAMILKDDQFPKTFLNEVVYRKLIIGNTINKVNRRFIYHNVI